jgi:protein-S-isoprenylcysteine O-methyltransferase Ste14
MQVARGGAAGGRPSGGVAGSAMRIRMAAASLAGTAVFLGLAVLGEGGFAAFAARPPLLGAAAVTFAGGVAAPFSQANLSAGLREDRANRWVIPALALLGLLQAWMPAWTDRNAVAVLPDWLRWPGLALYAGGMALRLWPVFVLGRRFSGLVAIQPGHRLVTDGLYGRVRNPSYLGLLVLGVGWALVFRAWAGLAIAALMLVPLSARIRAEEALMQAEFGNAYAAYRSRTWRLLPGVY